MNIQKNVSLKPFNTLAINATAAYFVSIKEASEIPECINFAQINQLPLLVLGSGSNIVLSENFKGLVIKLETMGIKIQSLDHKVEVTVAAGENWHHLVLRCLAQGLYGLENLSLIPGNIGAAPIQNIGAYGVELESCFSHLKGWDIEKQCWLTLNKEQCKFAYRDSIFKNERKDKFIITEVTLLLSKQPSPLITYPALKAYLEKHKIADATPYQVAEAIIAIRSKKLPSPNILPNVGSFFKNPIITRNELECLKVTFPDIVNYEQGERGYKLAAGWLLEKAGWKGKSSGNVSLHSEQALVLINRGGDGPEIKVFVEQIIADINKKFGVVLEVEPRIY